MPVKGVEENTIAAELAAARANGTGPGMISCSLNLMIYFSKKGWISAVRLKKLWTMWAKRNSSPDRWENK
ncbi:hypothetical protein [Desulfovibrio sp. JC022]|uniref:hypothetical protein n=1 Tax=Desulfovibrio sp. JC022 TaxID=2593642 RepID=UPI0013D50E45|nr:hypothetical protein [Desulfovibrio sp. JC022]NDV22041.1 hypothetical protein [Desulfovibrio sp. JC022]